MEDACNTLRVLVATDCHLGYMEKDEIRRFDSFRAFEEICSIAEEKEVDFILLGGDLFHENKPSRATLVKTIEIIRRYSLNDRPVQFQIVSDQTINFENMFGHVNYEDPHFNVGLPVFTIHGNHDDPAGVDNLSAIDILSTCNLVNYFGKMVLGGSAVGQIRIHPILIRKGTTSMALYGIGNIRDERLNRMFQTPHSIQWIRPQSQEDCQLSDWFNILVLHQNRIKSNPKNAINEHFLPRFLDFIVWGHEHECLVDPMEIPGMGFHITQPGSSVATSLIEGEAKPKHILLLEVKGTQYRSTKIPLTSVRPFEYFEVVLKDVADVNPNDQDSVLEYLDKLVIKMIEKCSRITVNKPDLKLPLVRIKVDYSGFMTINPQRFGQKYVGKVANPQDILIFSKSVKKRQSLNESDEKEQLRPEELNQQNIEALVAESNLKMEILPVNDLDSALHDFVNKDEKMAFYSCLHYNLDETRDRLNKEAEILKMDDGDLAVRVEQCMQERVKERTIHSKKSAHNFSSSHIPEDRGKNTASRGSSDAFSDEEDATLVFGAKSRLHCDTSGSIRGRGAAKRGRGRGTTGLKQTTLDATLRASQPLRSTPVSVSATFQSIADDDAKSLSSDDSEYKIKEAAKNYEPEESHPVRGRKRAAPARGRGRGKGSTLSTKRAKKIDKPSMQSMLMDADDDEDSEDDVQTRLQKSQPKVMRNYGAVRKRF